MAEQFQGLISTAANVPTFAETETYTKDMFLEDFPQFVKRTEDETEPVSLVPSKMLELFVNNASKSILSSRYCDMWRYAAGLYTAHFSSLYLKTYSEGSSSAGQVAISGQQIGLVKSTTMGDTSISYDNTAITMATEKWGSWNATEYGRQLVTMARMVGMGGMYVI